MEDDGGGLTTIRTSSWKEAATFDLDGRSYTVRKVGWPGFFTLRQDGTEVASARKLGWFSSRIELRVGRSTYGIKLRSIFSSTYELRHRGRKVGSIRSTSWWTRRAEADLPDELAPDAKVFTVWIVLAMWKRAESAG